MKRALRNVTIFLALLTLVIACTALFGRAEGDSPGATPAGDGAGTIRATGKLEPEEVIDVGAQMCGRILSLGRDADGKAIDSGSSVEEGMVLATIDDRLAAAEVAQAEAALKQARSTVQRAEADLAQHKAKLPEAEARWTGTQHLQTSGATNTIELITYKSSYEVAKANVAVGQAAIMQARDAVAQAEATSQLARQKDSYSVIRSPVKGVILERRVSVGQTIICNMNTPSLFLIAKDLQRMRIRAAVGETDIGKIQRGQPVQFTVDALPGQTFGGSVEKVCLNGHASQRGTTYTVEITTDNPDGKLLPYLTARVQFAPNCQ